MVAAYKRPADGGAETEPKKVKFEKKPFEKRPFEKKPFEKRPFEKKPFEKKPFEKKPFEKKPFERKPVGKNPFNNRNGGSFAKGGFNDDKKKFNKFEKPGGKFIKKEGDNKFSKRPDEAGTDGQQTSTEKVDWNLFKQKKKELKMKRKGTRDLYDIAHEAKQVYEQLRCKTTADKEALCNQLHTKLRLGDNYQKLVLAHDTARVVQCMLKHSHADIKREISQKLIPIFTRMATSKYSHFCASRMIQYGTPDVKADIIESVYGSILKMINNAQAAGIIDTIYISWASSQQKAAMRQELYGDLYKKSKDNNVKCIADTYKDSPHMKLAVLNAVKANLNHVVNKKLVDNSLVHAVLLDYLNECSEEERGEMVTAFAPYVPSLASTKDGTRAAIICFWNSIVKDRRAIVKTLREHLTKICTHEHGYVLILAIVNSMDDTKALKKAIFDQLFAEIETLITNEWGRRVIEWFVAPGDTVTFHPHINAVLEEGLKFSKKDKDTRRAELLEAVEEPLCNAIAANPSLFLRGGHTGLATAAILKNCKGDNLKKAFDSLAEVICTPDWKVPTIEIDATTELAQATATKAVDEAAGTAAPKKIKKKKIFVGNEDDKAPAKPEEFESGIEHAGLHVVLKKILKLGKDTEEVKFSASLADKLTEEVVEQWLPLNRAAFLILNAYENASTETQAKLKALVAKKLKTLKQQKHAASKLLLKNLGLK